MRYFLAALFGVFIVDSTHAAGVVEDSSGVTVGAFLGFSGPGRIGPSSNSQERHDFHLLSNTGYEFVVSYTWLYTDYPDIFSDFAYVRPFGLASGNDTAHVLFESTDCSGQGYLRGVRGGFVTNTQVEADSLFEFGTADALWYSPKGSQFQRIQGRSQLFPGSEGLTCSQVDDTEVAVPVFPNEPSVTGVSSPRFSPPLRVDVDPAYLANLFADRFEAQGAE